MGLLSRRLKYNCERGGHVKEQEQYIAIYVGMDNTYDLGVLEAENGNFDWLVDYIMEDIIANEEHSIEELKKMKETLGNKRELVSSKRFYRIVEKEVI